MGTAGGLACQVGDGSAVPGGDGVGRGEPGASDGRNVGTGEEVRQVVRLDTTGGNEAQVGEGAIERRDRGRATEVAGREELEVSSPMSIPAMISVGVMTPGRTGMSW